MVLLVLTFLPMMPSIACLDLRPKNRGLRIKRSFVVLAGLAALGAASPLSAQNLEVSSRDCVRLVEHRARADVEYKPGIDSRGRPVKPADLNPGPMIAAPQTFSFDANVDLKKFGVPTNSALFQPSVGVGKITVEDGGRRVLYNGQSLGNREQEALAELCRQRQGR